MKEETGTVSRMTAVKWMTWICLLGSLTLSAAQCHNNVCSQTNFRDYTACIQGSCVLNNCQCSNIACNSCSMSTHCCQKCCPVVISCNNCQGNNCPSNCPVVSNCNNCQGSNCPSNCPVVNNCNNCQGNNCPSNCPVVNNCQGNNCPSNCPNQPGPCPVTTTTTQPPRTCRDINCYTCRGEECMGCCVVTTKQSGEPVTRPTPTAKPCNITNIIQPEIKLPNITITINQPPIHITSGPVLNNISIPCPTPGAVNCPSPRPTVVVVPSNNTNCCQVPISRCVPTPYPGRPRCYNHYQPACGPRCQYPQPLPLHIPVPVPQRPQYYPVYVPQPQPMYVPQPQPMYVPQPQPMYVPQPQYIPVPQPQHLPCRIGGCAVMPCSDIGCYGVVGNGVARAG